MGLRRFFSWFHPWGTTVVIVGALGLLALLAWMPESFGIMRAAQVAAVVTVVVGGALLLPGRWCRGVIIGFLGLVALVALWPTGSPLDPQRYAARLLRYDGVPYVWGGEGERGVDCSGLLRRAWIVEAFQEGCAGRPDLLRQAALRWWWDASAADLLSGRGGTVSTPWQGRLDQVPWEQLQPGDLAVTSNGIHCLAYLGGNRWISADPAAKRVIVTPRGDPSFSWWSSQVSIRRWE